jgi:hypothetical protein
LKRSDLCQTDLVSGPQPTLQVPGDPPLIPSPSSVLALYFSYPPLVEGQKKTANAMSSHYLRLDLRGGLDADLPYPSTQVHGPGSHQRLN